MIIADSDDIRFDCSQCGQHLVVEAAGAGLSADCPICNTTVTVPPPGSSARLALTASIAPEALRSNYADPTPDDLREELIDASLINGKLVRDLTKAREEVARLQQQLKSVSDECERLNTSGTHTQAELKTFQTERQQLKTELSGLRQKLAAAEETLTVRNAELSEASNLAADWEAKATATQKLQQDTAWSEGEWKARAEMAGASLADAVKLAADREASLQQARAATADFESKASGLEQALANEQTQRAQLAAELTEKARLLNEAHPQLATLNDDLHKTRWRLGEVEAVLAGAQETSLRLTTERGDLQQRLDEATVQLAEAGDLKTQLARSSAELHEKSEKLRLAEEARETLTTRCEQLRREGETLRRDLGESHTGREVLELRARLETSEAERDRTATRLSEVETDLRAFTSTQAAARAELEHARAERDDALERVEALRESRAAKDNQVLRGIIARLNADLAQHQRDLVRLKRGRFGLKIAYLFFALGFLAVVAFALVVLPHALRP